MPIAGKIGNEIGGVFACYLCIAVMFLLKHNIYELISVQYYLITIIIPIFLLFFLMPHCKGTIEISHVDALLIILFVWVFIHSIVTGVSIDNISKFGILGLFYILCKCCYKKTINLEIIILPFLVVSGIESVLFLLQYFIGGADTVMPSGTLGNSARLCGVLMMLTPFCILMFKSSNNVFKKIYATIFILNNSVIILAFSRAAIIALLIAYIYLAYKNNYIRFSKKYIILCVVVVCLILSLLVVLKYDSVVGRLLIWKITLLQLYPNFLLGKGIDSFIPLYNNAQSLYFAKKIGVFDKESSVAGFVAYPYNEILNTLVELGLIPCIIVVVIIYILLKTKTESTVGIYLKSIILATLVFSMFSYTSKVYLMLVVFTICIAVLDVSNSEKKAVVVLSLNSVIYVSSSDSIFFCQINPNRIYLIDSNGYIVNRWLQDDLMIKIADDEYLSRYDITFTTFLGQFRPLVLDNHIIIGLDPSGMYKVISNIKRVGIYDMVHKKWNKFISKASDVESNISKLGYPYDLEQPYIADGDKCIIVSYPMDHYIYVYSKSNYEFISKVPCYSKYVSYLPYPLPLKQINSCQKNWNFRVQVPFYGAVNYHPEKDMYTRIIYHPQSLIDDNGNVNSGMDRSASIIIMNNQFEIIGETLFDKGQLGVYSYLPMSDGLLTAPQINNDYDSIFNYKNIMTLE